MRPQPRQWERETRACVAIGLAPIKDAVRAAHGERRAGPEPVDEA
jgi:hypothetical protein